jgi:hypothetical protein
VRESPHLEKYLHDLQSVNDEQNKRYHQTVRIVIGVSLFEWCASIGMAVYGQTHGWPSAVVIALIAVQPVTALISSIGGIKR